MCINMLWVKSIWSFEIEAENSIAHVQQKQLHQTKLEKCILTHSAWTTEEITYKS